MLSWGPCQFATLGFVVDRAWKIERFVAEDFWSVSMALDRGQGHGSVTFDWARGRCVHVHVLPTHPVCPVLSIPTSKRASASDRAICLTVCLPAR